MKTVLGGWFKRCFVNRSQASALEIEEEFRFHLELLTQAYLQEGMPADDARNAAILRFGNVELIKRQCLTIRSRSFLIGVKTCLTLVFVTGIVVLVLSQDINTRHVGELLIVVSILSCLWLHVRCLHPSRFLSGAETKSPLGLHEDVYE